jgi:hypothetical protein
VELVADAPEALHTILHVCCLHLDVVLLHARSPRPCMFSSCMAVFGYQKFTKRRSCRCQQV